MIGLFVRLSSEGVDLPQKKINEKISKKLHLWIAEKKYCIPDMSVAEVAEEFGVSEEELSCFFSTVMDSRFSSVRKRLRLEEARRLINEYPNMKIIQVANRVGIRDKCNFRKQFRELFGCSPSEWKAECSKSSGR